MSLNQTIAHPTSKTKSGNRVLSHVAMALLAVYPLLNWYAIPFPLSLGMTLMLLVALVGVFSFRLKMLPSVFYGLMFYIFAMWSVRQGMSVSSLIPPGGTLFFIFLISLAGCVALFDLKTLRRYMGIIVAVSIPVFWFQLAVLQVSGHNLCFVPNLTGHFTYQDLSYAELVQVHALNRSPCSIFLEKSYLAYYLVSYLCLRLFSSDLRDKFLFPVNIIIILTLLMSRSGSGFVGLVALLSVKVIIDFYSGSSRKRTYLILLLIPLLAGMSYVYMQSEIGTSMAERSSEFNTEGTSGYARVVSGYVVFGALPPSEKLLGASIRDITAHSDFGYISDERFYVNGVQTILMTLGWIGFFLYVFFYAYVFRRTDILARMVIITLLIFSLIESDYLNPYHLLLTVIPCALLYYKR